MIDPREEYVPDWPTTPSEREVAHRGDRERMVRGEHPVMTDGQLPDAMDRGPERRNPEGSADISNLDYRES